MEAIGVDVTDKESNRLAQAAAEDTANVLGGREQYGSRNYGPTEALATTRQETRKQGQLSSLFDEEMPDLLAASCVARRTINNVRYGTHEPAEETWTALEVAMNLLDPSKKENIVGWRNLITAEELASVLGCTLKDATKRFQGHQTWNTSERTALVHYVAERRVRLAPSTMT